MTILINNNELTINFISKVDEITSKVWQKNQKENPLFNLNELTEFKLYLPLSDWYVTKWNFICFQINRKLVYTIWFQFLRPEVDVWCACLTHLCPPLRSTFAIVSEGFKGGTSGAPIMPRDAVSRTANVERTGRHKWVNNSTSLNSSDNCVQGWELPQWSGFLVLPI